MNGVNSGPQSAKSPLNLRPRAAKLFATLFAAFLITASTAHANVGEAFGFGSKNAALGGLSVATSETDGFSAYNNPALLAAPGGKRRLYLSWGMKLMSPSFTPITGVVVENNYTSDKVPARTGTVDTEYRDTLGQELGFTYVLFPEWNRFTFGLTAFLPLDSVAYLDSGEAFQPEYFMYRSRTQRPQIEIATGLQFSDQVSFGVGGHVGYSITSNATVFLQTSQNRPSTARIAASLKPKIAPYFGLLYKPSVNFHLGLVTRLALKSNNTLILNSSSRVLGNFGALDILMSGSGAQFYDPLTFELGTSFALSSVSRLFLQADYQVWKNFESPAISIQNTEVPNCSGAGCAGLQISPSRNPGGIYRNILIPRIGQEWRLSDEWTLRYGYSYRQSILAEIPNGAGNALDPSKHQFSAGLGLKIRQFLGFELPALLDFHFGYQALQTQVIEKTAGNEAGDTSDQKIGAPGYQAGGKILGGGLSLSLAL